MAIASHTRNPPQFDSSFQVPAACGLDDGRAASYVEASARERVRLLFDTGTFDEFAGTADHCASPHLALFGVPASPDDGVAVGRARLDGHAVFVAAQDGRFMGGAIGEVHGAKLAGMLRRALAERPYAVLLLADSGGVRLHEANAGLVGVAEVLRAVLDVRAAGIPVITLVGGANGAFGGMGIIACSTNAVVMSARGRLGMSGPEVIETAHGAAEFDARDRDLVWRTTGGRHRRLLGDCDALADDTVAAFRTAAMAAIATAHAGSVAPTVAALQAEHALLTGRIARFGALSEPADVWTALGVPDAATVPLLATAAFNAMADALPALAQDSGGERGGNDGNDANDGNGADGGGRDNWTGIAARLFPQGHRIERHGALIRGTARVDGRTVAVVGTCGHAAIGVELALAQARSVLDTVLGSLRNTAAGCAGPLADAARAEPPRPIVLLVDTEGQRLRRRDEMLGIARYMAHLGKCIDVARRHGHPVVALVYGQALSGGFVTSGLAADSCHALHDAAIRVMALPAMARITKIPLERLQQLAATHPVFAPGPENFLRMGALNGIWPGGPAPLDDALAQALRDCPRHDNRAALGAQRGGRTRAARIIDAIVEGRRV